MPAINAISAEKLARLVGTPCCPAIVDLREAPSALAPGALIRAPDLVEALGKSLGAAG